MITICIFWGVLLAAVRSSLVPKVGKRSLSAFDEYAKYQMGRVGFNSNNLKVRLEKGLELESSTAEESTCAQPKVIAKQTFNKLSSGQPLYSEISFPEHGWWYSLETNLPLTTTANGKLFKALDKAIIISKSSKDLMVLTCESEGLNINLPEIVRSMGGMKQVSEAMPHLELSGFVLHRNEGFYNRYSVWRPLSDKFGLKSSIKLSGHRKSIRSIVGPIRLTVGDKKLDRKPYLSIVFRRSGF